MERETRTLEIELRVTRGEDGKSMIRGHAAVFSQLSEDLGGFREQIVPGAFTTAIDTDDVRALWNHNPDFILGRNRSKTLRLSEDVRGLSIEIDPPDTQTVRDLVLTPMERGDVTQMSFAFSLRPNGEDWAKDDNGLWIRTVKNVRLFDVSPVTYPAYPQTDVAVAQRSLCQTVEQIEASEAARSAQEWRDAMDILQRRQRLAAV